LFSVHASFFLSFLIYPADVVDTLSRKSWRQKVRNKLGSLKMTMLEISDQKSKEYKAAKAAYEAYENEVTKKAS